MHADAYAYDMPASGSTICIVLTSSLTRVSVHRIKFFLHTHQEKSSIVKFKHASEQR